MASGRFIGLFMVAAVLLSVSLPQCLSQKISRGSFPEGFVFGTASSAFQYEGAVKEDGRGMSWWDTFSHTKGKITDGSNADVAVDQYHRYPEDIQLMKDMGMDAYRFSISWPRIFPDGTGKINQAGVDHYNSLINALIAEGIEPYVTLYHWDLPQALADKYNGWLDPQIIEDFGVYAETCFEQFGDRVKQWTTFNEPHVFTVEGYTYGIKPPERCSFDVVIPIVKINISCPAGNSFTEPYIVARHVLLSHATVAHIYRNKYKEEQQGSLGLAFSSLWFEPRSSSKEDSEAAQRAMDFQLGWFLDPLMFGDYPESMKKRLGNRLPSFTEDESDLLKGSLDFVGINHYSTWYADNDATILNCLNLNGGSDVLPIPIDRNCQPIGDKANSPFLYIVPRGIRSLMIYINHKYKNPPVIITENGMDDPNNQLIPIEDALKDEKRIKYHHDYLQSLLASIKEDGCNVKGYFVWSLLDNWEWESGFTSRFGLFFVDFNDNLKRYPKNSVQWFKDFLNSP